MTRDEADVTPDSLAVIMAELRALRTEVNGRFDGINHRIDGMAVRVDDMARRNDEQHARTAEQLADLHELSANIDSEVKILGTVSHGARLLSETNATDIAQHLGMHERQDGVQEGRAQVKSELMAPVKKGIEELPKVMVALLFLGAGGVGYLINYVF